MRNPFQLTGDTFPYGDKEEKQKKSRGSQGPSLKRSDIRDIIREEMGNTTTASKRSKASDDSSHMFRSGALNRPRYWQEGGGSVGSLYDLNLGLPYEVTPGSEGDTLRQAMTRLAQVEQARNRLISGGMGALGPKAYKQVLTSLDKERSELNKLILGIQKEQKRYELGMTREQNRVYQTDVEAESKQLPYRMMAQQQTQEQNRKVFENLVRHYAGLEEGAPLPSIAQKYYQESLNDPQRAAYSVARDLAIDKMQTEWPKQVDKVASVMRQRFGRPLTDEELKALSRGDINTIVQGNELLNTEPYQKLRQIPLDGTVDLSPTHALVHGFREMRDTDGKPFLGRFETAKDGTVNVVRLTPSEGGLLREKRLFGQHIYGSQVPQEVFTGQDVKAKPIEGGPHGLFQGPQGTFYRSYTGMGGSIAKQDIPIHRVQTMTVQDLLRPEVVAEAGVSFGNVELEKLGPAGRALLVMDALNKANMARGKQVAVTMTPQEHAQAQAEFREYENSLRDYGQRLLRGERPWEPPKPPEPEKPSWVPDWRNPYPSPFSEAPPYIGMGLKRLWQAVTTPDFEENKFQPPPQMLPSWASIKQAFSPRPEPAPQPTAMPTQGGPPLQGEGQVQTTGPGQPPIQSIETPTPTAPEKPETPNISMQELSPTMRLLMQHPRVPVRQTRYDEVALTGRG